MPQTPPISTAANLVPGQVYRVTAPFTDYDGMTHPVGETWRFVSKSFLPYEDGLTLTVEQDGQRQGIRLQWRPETQAEIIERFAEYVTAVDPAPAQSIDLKVDRPRPNWAGFAIGFFAAAFITCLAAVGLLLYLLSQ